MIIAIIKMSLIVALAMAAVIFYGSHEIGELIGYGAALVYGGAVVLFGWCLANSINS